MRSKKNLLQCHITNIHNHTKGKRNKDNKESRIQIGRHNKEMNKGNTS